MLWCQNLLHVGCLDDEPAEDDKTTEVEECGRWITKDSQRTLVTLRLLVISVSLGLLDTLVGQPLNLLRQKKIIKRPCHTVGYELELKRRGGNANWGPISQRAQVCKPGLFGRLDSNWH